MFLRLLLAFTLIPLAELAILFQLSKLTSWTTTVLLVFGTGLAGAALARRQGRQAIREVTRLLAEGQMPSTQVVDGLLILLAGAFLITPGLLTDLAGLSLLFPPMRRFSRAQLIQWIGRRAVNLGGSDSGSRFGVQSAFYFNTTTSAVPPTDEEDSHPENWHSARPQVRVVDPKSPRLGQADSERSA